MADFPFEDKIDLKKALDELLKVKSDAIDVMIYVTLRWKVTPLEIAKRVQQLKLKGKDKVVVIGKFK